MRDSISGILRPVSSRLCTGASRCRGEAIVFSVAHLGCLDFFQATNTKIASKILQLIVSDIEMIVLPLNTHFLLFSSHGMRLIIRRAPRIITCHEI